MGLLYLCTCIYREWKYEISSRTETVVNMDIYDCERGMGDISLEQVMKAQRGIRCIATPFL